MSKFINFIHAAQSWARNLPLPVAIRQYFVLCFEYIYNMFHYFDPSRPSTKTRIERYIQQGRQETQRLTDAGHRRPVAIITGANTGIGYETAKSIALAGYYVVMACLKEEKPELSRDQLIRETGLTDSFEVIHINLVSLRSIDAFVNEFKKRGLPINLIIANAGVMMLPKYIQTEDGLESQFQINYLGHFYLITSLLDIIKQSDNPRPRILILSSIVIHFADKFDYDLILDKNKYSYNHCYFTSKMASVMFSKVLARRLEGTGITVNSLHPGVAATGLYRHLPNQIFWKYFNRYTNINAYEASATSVLLALSPDVKDKTGLYWAHETIQDPNPVLLDSKAQEQLWLFSEKLITDIKSKWN
ncbi:hypothetical protein EV182_003901 [Spiromyces aspiralis]|uniref:Uncharacterized protein n=1 Tax=Spiromyces aspiralis TaxID=68401 RepID=A0ACC1HET0_9FUNG|nr:hypothetical protein EV182_003901 [Spiromyces aspiralis]